MCSARGCTEVHESVSDAIAHLLHEHVPEDGTCVLCPPSEQGYRYPNKISFIQHLERHLSAPDVPPRFKHECPYCWNLHADRGNWTKHVQCVHLRVMEVLGFAGNMSVVPEDQIRLVGGLLPEARTSALNIQSARLSKNLRYAPYRKATSSPHKALSTLAAPQVESPPDLSMSSSSAKKSGPASAALMAKNTRRTVQLQNFEVVLDEEGRFPCPLKCCDTIFSEGRVAAEHIRDVHGNSCPVCPSRKATSSGLLDHIQRHLPATIKCTVCKYKARTTDDMKKHMKSKHNG